MHAPSQRAPKRDDEVDRVRTVLWFETLKFHLSADRPRDVERAIAPAPTTDGQIKNNKFLGYAKGDHVPRGDVVRKAAERCPESDVILNHVLWDALRVTTPLEKCALDLIKKLKPDIQRAVLQPKNKIGLTAYTLGVLERRPGLDSLAALSILFRLKHNNGLTYSLRPIAHSMFCMLMMLTPVFITDETRNEIFQLFSRRVFSLVESLIGTCIDMNGYDYVETSYLFTRSFLNLSEHEPMSKAYLDYKQRLVESEARLSRKSHTRLHALLDIHRPRSET